jgi:hypothetical protein
MKTSKELDIAPPLTIKWRKKLLKYGIETFCGNGNGHLRLNPEQKKNLNSK